MRQLVLILFLASTACAVRCPGAKVAAKEVRAARATLLQVDLGPDDMGMRIPGTVQHQISAFKSGLVQLSDAVLACSSVATVSTASVENILNEHLGHEVERVPKPSFEDAAQSVGGFFGRESTAKVSAPRPGFIFVEFSFGIICGADSVLLLYRAADRHWNRVLRWQSEPYDKVSEAFGDFFQYSLINDAKTNELAVVAAHGSPWCTSRWSAFDIDVLIPETGSIAQKQIYHRELGYVREEPVRWKTLRSGVELRTEDAFLDLGVMTKKVVFRYMLDGGVLSRVQPVAMNGIGFVDEWLQSDWADAGKWTSPQHLDALRTLHSQISKRLHDESGSEFGYGSLRRCQEKDEYEAIVTIGNDSHYLRIRQEQNAFTMLAGSAKETCSGVDISASH